MKNVNETNANEIERLIKKYISTLPYDQRTKEETKEDAKSVLELANKHLAKSKRELPADTKFFGQLFGKYYYVSYPAAAIILITIGLLVWRFYFLENPQTITQPGKTITSTKIEVNETKETERLIPNEETPLKEKSKYQHLDYLLINFEQRAFNNKTEKRISNKISNEEIFGLIVRELENNKIIISKKGRNSITTEWDFSKGNDGNYYKNRLLVAIAADNDNKINFILETVRVKIDNKTKNISFKQINYKDIIKNIKKSIHKND